MLGNHISFDLYEIEILIQPFLSLSLSLRYALGRFVFEFDKIRMGDVIVTSFRFSANNFPYFKFY